MAVLRKRGSKTVNQDDSNKNVKINLTFLQKKAMRLIRNYEAGGLLRESLYQATVSKKIPFPRQIVSHLTCISVILCNLIYICWLYHNPSVKCLVPNSNLLQHIVRPPSACDYCKGLTQVKTFGNLTKEEFQTHAYRKYPMVLKNSFGHWHAKDYFDYDFFKSLYNQFEDAHAYNFYDGCKYFPYESGVSTLEDFFAMDAKRLNQPWYVGWGNCDPEVLEEMRKYYPKPHFLPDDCEIPSKEYVFMGYDAGATMHLDFINRLMWQAQLQGTKTWHLKPSPECEHVCHPLSFLAEPGDAVLIDTRVWYHGTTIRPGEFSLAIQSEYG